MDTTEKQILSILQKRKMGMTISEIALTLKKERHTTAKYLEKMQSAGSIEMQIRGKSKLYTVSGSSLISAMKKNAALTHELSQIFDATGQKILLKTKDNMKSPYVCTAYSGTEACCKNCVVEETFKTGKPSSSTNKHADIKAHPITKNNKVIAVVEIINQKKRNKEQYK